MKKLIITLIIALLFISSISYAQEKSSPEIRQKREAVYTTSQKVYQNRILIKNLSAEVRTKTKLVKDKIHSHLISSNSLSAKQLNALKASISKLKEDQMSLKNTVGQISPYDKAIRAARLEKDYDTLLILYKETLQIQKLRIDALKQYNKTLDNILTQL